MNRVHELLLICMKILVTGGTGFIGRHLVNKLLLLGHEVVVLADETKGNPPEGSEYIKGDIRDGYNVKKAFEGCECVFHLAAITDVRDSNDEAVYATNFLGSKNVFEVAKAKNAKIIFTSTAAVYGNGNIPNREMDECKPISQYGKSKLRAEWYLQNLVQDSFIVRLFNVYGTGGHSFINVLAEKMPKYDDISIFGNGLQTRDYVHVDDVLDALLLGFNNSGLYNVGTGVECSTSRLVEVAQEITKYKPNLKFTPPKKNDIARNRADITKIKSIGWEPKMSLEEGIKSMFHEAEKK
jgi:nucleoside-diphosphate-sugar epimerase